MNSATPFRNFFYLILTAFLFTWFGLVVFPWIMVGNLTPIQDEGGTDILPWDTSGAAHQGEHVYAANGCAYCHTQQVRPASSGADITRGWGTSKDADDKDITRRTYPRDYIWQHQVFLGNNRNGSDLSNVGARYSSEAQLYRYLYAPSVVSGHSSMPAYKFLFVTQKVTGAPSVDALLLGGTDAPPAGFEIIPTAEAKSLVAYLLSLKKNYHLPDEKGPVAATPATKS